MRLTGINSSTNLYSGLVSSDDDLAAANAGAGPANGSVDPHTPFSTKTSQVGVPVARALGEWFEAGKNLVHDKVLQPIQVQLETVERSYADRFLDDTPAATNNGTFPPADAANRKAPRDDIKAPSHSSAQANNSPDVLTTGSLAKKPAQMTQDAQSAPEGGRDKPQLQQVKDGVINFFKQGIDNGSKFMQPVSPQVQTDPRTGQLEVHVPTAGEMVNNVFNVNEFNQLVDCPGKYLHEHWKNSLPQKFLQEPGQVAKDLLQLAKDIVATPTMQHAWQQGNFTEAGAEALMGIATGVVTGKFTPIPNSFRAPDVVNKYGFVTLVKNPLNNEVRSVELLPALDPGSGYVLSIKSMPGRPVELGATPGAGARINGQLTKVQAPRDRPHLTQVEQFFPSISEKWIGQDGQQRYGLSAYAGAYIEYMPDGTVTFGNKSVAFNATTQRVGTREFPSQTANSNQQPGNTAFLDDREAILNFAQYAANATQRPVRIGDLVHENQTSLTGTIIYPQRPSNL